MTSTSGNCATGLKKCRPISREGNRSPSAMRSSSIGLDLSEDLALDLEIFDHRLDDHIGPRHALAGGIGLEPRHGGGNLGPPLEALLEQRFGPHESRIDPLHVEVLQRHAKATERAPGGDVAAHDAGADHMDTGKARLFRTAQTELLEALGKKEHAPQIARRVGRHQRHEATGFAVDHGPPVVAVPLEQVDQRMRRGIVLALGFFRGFRPHRLDDLRADRAPGHDPLDQRRRRRLALLQHRLARLPVQRIAVSDQLVDEAHALCRARLDHPAGQHCLHGIDRTRLPDRAAGTAEAREDAEIDFGEAEPRFFVVHRHPIVAGERQLEPAAEAEAADRRDDGRLHVFDAIHHRMRPLQRLRKHRGIGHRVELADIGAGDETGVLARLDDEPDDFARRDQVLDAQQNRLEFGDRQPA
jgi:hypothetical protein